MDQLLAIRAFARVVESGSFTRAADSLNLPKTSVSKLVRDLERHLGVKLLQRTTRKLAVTADGGAYYEKTSRLVRELEDVDTSFASAHARPRGRIRVDVGGTLANMVIIPALPDFFLRYPDIQVDLGVSDRRVDLIGENVDCAIRGGNLPDQRIVARLLGTASWSTCASPEYLEKYGRPAHPMQLATEHKMVKYQSAATGRIHPAHFFGKNGESIEIEGSGFINVNESTAHVAAGVAGLGVIQNFSYSVKPYVDSGLLIPILEDWQGARYPFHLVYAPNRHLSNRLRVFIDWVADQFGRLP